MLALVVNCIVGSAIYGVPSEVTRLVGGASPLAMIVAALLMAIVVLPIAEVASQFTEPGGMYLYARTAFGRFVGLQIGWFWLLAIVGGGAAGANLFLSYLEPIVPSVAHGVPRVAILLLLISIPSVANYLGVRQGASLAFVLTVAKLLPLALLIVLGALHFGEGAHSSSAIPSSSAGWSAWVKALLILVYAYSGWEDALVPSGEVKEPRRTVPFALVIGLSICALIYTLLQFTIVRTIGNSSTEHPVVDTVSVLIGHGAGLFVAVAVMISTYGWISGAFLNAPRLAVSFAQQGDCPSFLGKLHPRFHTPSAGILLYAVAVAALAVTGTFLWVVAVTAGAVVIFYLVACAALIRLRHLQPKAPAFRAPLGPGFAMLGILVSVVLMTELEVRQLGLMCFTSLVAAANWFWATRHTPPVHSVPSSASRVATSVDPFDPTP